MLTLLISIAVILIVLGLRLHPGFAVLAGSLIVLVLALPLASLPSCLIESLIDYQTLRLFVMVTSALTLSSLMQERGLLAKLAATLEGINPKLALHLIPSVIGLVPMPAGALVSATASQGLAKRMRLAPDQITFINYWFRHIWEFFLPVYPSIILTSVVFSVPFSFLVVTLCPLSVVAVAIGSIINYRILKSVPKMKGESHGNIALDLLKASWPILTILSLVLVGVDAVIAFPLPLILLTLQQRPKWHELRQALKYGLDLKILLLLYAIMLYKATIEDSGIANAVFQDMRAIGLSSTLILVLLPFIMGFASGYGPTFAGIALPLLVPFVIQSSTVSRSALLVAYTSGYIGLLLSPLHLCLILSARYFGARLARVYRYVLIPTLIIESLVLVIYSLVN